MQLGGGFGTIDEALNRSNSLQVEAKWDVNETAHWEPQSG